MATTMGRTASMSDFNAKNHVMMPSCDIATSYRTNINGARFSLEPSLPQVKERRVITKQQKKLN